MSVVSSGQVTIFDNNDARTITAYITPNVTVAQTITSTTTLPDWTASSLVLTAKVNVSGVLPATVLNKLSERMFVFDPNSTTSDIPAALVDKFLDGSGVQSTSTNFVVAGITAGQQVEPTLTISANLKKDIVNVPIYFKAKFLDPATNQPTDILSQITLSSLKTGTDAVTVEVLGDFNVESAPNKTDGRAIIGARLTKLGVVDTTDLIYRWFVYPAGSGTPTHINSGYAGKAKLKISSTDLITTPAPTIVNGAALNSGFPTVAYVQGAEATTTSGSTYATGNCLSVSEEAVLGITRFRVEIYDTVDAKTYGTDFSLVDPGDQYQITIDYTTNVFKNATGTATLTPKVFNGKDKPKAGVAPGPMLPTDLKTWKFYWYLRDQNGNPSAFTSTNKLSGGASITSNTTTTVTAASVGGLVAGDLVKFVRIDGVTAYLAQILSIASTTITIGALSGDNATILGSSSIVRNATTPLISSELSGGTLYYCVPKQTTGATISTIESITVKDIDIENKGLITVDADSKPPV